MINSAITHISQGTAKTFEHLPSKFAFRAEGDGAFEPSVMDQFSIEAPVLESLNDRKFRAFLKKEQALQAPENSSRTADQGKAELQEMVTGSLGDGWTVEDYNAPLGGTPNVTKLELRDGGSTQEIYIDRYRRQPEIKLSSRVNIDGWTVSQNLGADLVQGTVDPEKASEQVFFSH
jgi:hypothetical protein